MSDTRVGNFEVLMLVIGGLWLYSRCCQLVLAQQYEDCLEEIELIYSERSDERYGGTA